MPLNPAQSARTTTDNIRLPNQLHSSSPAPKTPEATATDQSATAQNDSYDASKTDRVKHMVQEYEQRAAKAKGEPQPAKTHQRSKSGQSRLQARLLAFQEACKDTNKGGSSVQSNPGTVTVSKLVSDLEGGQAEADFVVASAAPKASSPTLANSTTVTDMAKKWEQAAAAPKKPFVSDQKAQAEKNLRLEKEAAEFWANQNTGSAATDD